MFSLSVAIVPEAIEFNIPHLPVSLLMSILVWIIIGGVSIPAARRISLVPGKIQIVVESILQYVFYIADEIIGEKRARRYYPLFAGLFLFILFSNIIGLIPGLSSPTADPNTTFGLAILVALYYNIEGLRYHGLKYLAHFTGPSLPWYLFPVRVLFCFTELLTLIVRPFSLGTRLFCNLFSKELFLAILAMLIVQFIASPVKIDKWISLAPILMRPVILLLGIMLGIIQALVFLVLSISYIGGAIQAQEH
jgi:F-type H+-transporting ATPase subunit a